ncbi:hypothetical protein [Microbacterium sp. KR10-403]|uniref:hypothetical protein n=1 Tax=Microbacterium sp. KR10-403 TaxID=3158581 RepID=UPI0032E50794
MGTLEMTTGTLGSVDLDPGIRAWVDAGPALDDGYSRRRALHALRRRGPEGVAALARAYRTGADAVQTALVQCAAELGSAEAGWFLVEVLDADIHPLASVAAETTRRVMALRGLTPLASTGDRDAADAIARAMRHPLSSVRYAAYATVRSLPDEIQQSAELRFGLLVLADEFRDLYEADAAG